MEPEEIKSHIYYQFKEIAKLEQEKNRLTYDLKNELMDVFKKYMPRLSKQEEEINNRVKEIYQASKDLKESFSCDYGRVIYAPPWGGNPEKLTIEGLYKEKDLDVLKMLKNQESPFMERTPGIMGLVMKIKGDEND